jgi:hypothetical protein
MDTEFNGAYGKVDIRYIVKVVICKEMYWRVEYVEESCEETCQKEP